MADAPDLARWQRLAASAARARGYSGLVAEAAAEHAVEAMARAWMRGRRGPESFWSKIAAARCVDGARAWTKYRRVGGDAVGSVLSLDALEPEERWAVSGVSASAEDEALGNVCAVELLAARVHRHRPGQRRRAMLAALLYAQGFTLDQVGDRLGVSGARICQMFKKFRVSGE